MTTPRGIRNNNPGNVRLSQDAWVGEVPGDDTSFMRFDTMAHGVRCLAKILLAYQRKGLVTIRQMINRWAPPVENDTGAYVNAVAKACGVAPDAVFPLTEPHLMAMTKAICAHENGGNYVSDTDLKSGVDMALS